MDAQARFVKTRKFTQTDMEERLKNPLRTLAFEVHFDVEDYTWEDTILLPIAAPRLVWKMLYGSAIAANTTIQDMASEWLSDTALDLLHNMKSFPGMRS